MTTEQATEQTTPETPPAEGSEENAPVTGAVQEQTEGSAAPPPEGAEGTGGEAPSETFDVGKELAELTGAEPAPSPAQDPRAGKTWEEFNKEMQKAQYQHHAQLRQGTDSHVVQALQQEYGLTAEKAAQDWNRIFKPRYDLALANHDAFVNGVDDYIIGSFDEETRTIFNERHYANRQEMFQGLVDTGRALEKAHLEQEKKKGNIVTRKTLDDIVEKATRHGMALAERRAGNGSGNHVNGAGSVTGVFSSERELNRAYNNGDIDHATFKREAERLGIKLS